MASSGGMASSDVTTSSGGKVLAYLQLMRLPNLFTAFGDIFLGFVLTHGSLQPAAHLSLLVVASGLLYTAGMVLNDFFDAEIDADERPHRPIPSGRVSLWTACVFGVTLLTLGALSTVAAVVLTGDFRPAFVAGVLVSLIIFYNAWAKGTPLGPVAMAGCRACNVLLGMSLSPHSWGATEWSVASGSALYIAGVTWFARQEAESSSRGGLIAGLLLMGTGITIWASFPWIAGSSSREIAESASRWVHWQWILLMALLGLFALRPSLTALATPSSGRVQAGVKQALFSLLFFDAALVLAATGETALALLVLLLLLPAVVLGRWVYST